MKEDQTGIYILVLNARQIEFIRQGIAPVFDALPSEDTESRRQLIQLHRQVINSIITTDTARKPPG